MIGRDVARRVVRVDHQLLANVGFSDHAIERFASRAGLKTTARRVVEPLVRELLVREGMVVADRPPWARSRNTADLYLQLGEWMLFIAMRAGAASRRTFEVVTVVNGAEDTDWRKALRRGYIVSTPPPEIADTGRGGISGLLAALARAFRPGR
jgi:hypothetical protein